MFGSELLEVAIGLVFIYLSISLICSGINELFAKIFGLRAKTLEEGLLKMLKDPDLVKKLLQHPLINDSGQSGLLKKVCGKRALETASNAEKSPGAAAAIPGKNSVINIPRHHFVPALVDILKNTESKRLIQEIEFAPVKEILGRAVDQVGKAKGDVENYIESERARIETWFDAEMEKMSAWYKKKSRQIILVVSIFLCGFLNVDTISIGKTFYLDNTMREAIVQVASERAAQPLESGAGQAAAGTAETASQPVAGGNSREVADIIKDIQEDMESVALPLGWDAYVHPGYTWKDFPNPLCSWVWKIIGILLTVLAVTLGAPFWYEILKKLIGLRFPAKKPN